MVHLLLAPPRHPAPGLTPQTPNVMLIRAEPLAHMPPWCPLLAAAAGTDSCAPASRAQQRAAHLIPAFLAGGGLGEPAPVSPIGGTGATRPAKKKPTCALTPVAQAARPPGLAPPRHPALGFAPQTPNFMPTHDQCSMCMPPWCLLLAAAEGIDSCARLAGAQQRAAHLLPAFFAEGGLGEPAPVPLIGGTGATRPVKKETYLETPSARGNGWHCVAMCTLASKIIMFQTPLARGNDSLARLVYTKEQVMNKFQTPSGGAH